MGQFAALFGISIVLFTMLDLLWLGLIAKNFYRAQMGPLMGEVQWIPAIVFYVVFVLGLTYFVTYPASVGGGVKLALLSGAFFGLVAYATYDLTNWATLKGWSASLSMVDMVWGALLGAAVSTFALLIYRFFI